MKFQNLCTHMKNLSLFLLMSVGLTGCETMKPQKSQAQFEHERVTQQLNASREQVKSCLEGVTNQQSIQTMNREILHESENSPNKYELIAKKEKPTGEQIEILKKAIPEATKCRHHTINGTSGTPFQVAMLKYYNSMDAIYIKLIKGELTIGEANEEKSKAMAQQKADWSQAAAEQDNRLRGMHNAEMEGRRQTAAAMLPYLMQQQQNYQMQQQLLYQQQMQSIINSRPILTAPTRTNCTTFGNQIDCTTR
jgi:hypothetical protein